MSQRPMFVISLDTEPDNEWARRPKPATENSRFVPRFHELCARHGLKVTYLLTKEMAECRVLRAYLRPRLAAGECEVGAHLHPWNTPPLKSLTDDDVLHHPYSFEYPEDLQRRKLETLVRAIERGYDTRPVAYRAGRWGIDGVHARILDDLGFVVDTSVSPGVSWRSSKGHPERQGGPDFHGAPQFPYPLSDDDVCRPGRLRLWEIPPTIVFYSALRHVPGVTDLYGRVKEFRRFIDRWKLGSQWLRPHPHMTAQRLAHVSNVAIDSGAPVLNLMFHSSELMPGGSPYNPTAESIEDLYRRLGEYFEWLAARSVEGVTLSEARHRVAADSVVQLPNAVGA